MEWIYLIFNGYDASDKGRSKLRIEKLGWDKEGWPFVEPGDHKPTQ